MTTAKNIREWQKNFSCGRYDDNSFSTQVDAGWYDWFCKTESLGHKTSKLGKIVSKICDGGKVALDSHYVWFKNNCPAVGPLYDDIRISRSDDNGHSVNDIVISVRDKREEHNYVVYSNINDFASPVFACDDARHLVKWINTPW